MTPMVKMIFILSIDILMFLCLCEMYELSSQLWATLALTKSLLPSGWAKKCNIYDEGHFLGIYNFLRDISKLVYEKLIQADKESFILNLENVKKMKLL